MAGTACIHDWPAQRVAVHYANSLAEAMLEAGRGGAGFGHTAMGWSMLPSPGIGAAG